MTPSNNSDFESNLGHLFAHLPSKREVEVFLDSRDSGKIKKKHEKTITEVGDTLERLAACVNDPVNKRKGDPVKAWHDHILSLENPAESIERVVTISIASGSDEMMMFINALCKKLQLHTENQALRKAAIGGLDRLYAVNVIFDRRLYPR